MDGGLLHETKSCLRSLIISCPRGLTIHQLDRDYREIEGRPIPFGELGFHTLEDFLRSISDTLQVSGSGSNASVFAVTSEKSAHIEELVSKQKNSSKRRSNCVQRNDSWRHNIIPQRQNSQYRIAVEVPPRFRKKIHHFDSCIKNFTENYKTNNLNNISDTFQRKTESAHLQKSINPFIQNDLQLENWLSIHEKKYTNDKKSSDICNSKLEDFKTINICENDMNIKFDEKYDNFEKSDNLNNFNLNDKIINLTKSFNEKLVLDNSIENDALPDLSTNDAVFLLDYPSSVVMFGQRIPAVELPDSIVAGATFGIFVTEIHNPFKFWFHVANKAGELDLLMKNIEDFYTSIPREELQIHPNKVKPTHACAALFFNLWHRAEILEEPRNRKVKLFFVDYGTVSSVPIENIKYLKKEYSILESQAIRGTLANIEPINHRWSRDATYAFLAMVSDLFIYAKTVDINYNEKTVNMLLTDTNGPQDFQINNGLISKGYARYCVNYIQKFAKATQEHFQLKYPSFDILENGQYPSFAEIGNLLAKGIDFEGNEDRNVIPDIETAPEINHFSKSEKMSEIEDNSHILSTSSLPIECKPSEEINSNPFLSISSNNPFLEYEEFENVVLHKPKTSLSLDAPEFVPSKYNSAFKEPLTSYSNDLSSIHKNQYDMENYSDRVYFDNNAADAAVTYNNIYMESSTPAECFRDNTMPFSQNIRPPPGFENFIPTNLNLSPYNFGNT